MEMQRLKDYSENIIESLTVGVSVIDEDGVVIGWNRVLEGQMAVRKEAALGRKLGDVLGQATYGALFPPEGQPEYRVFSEITLETAAGGRRSSTSPGRRCSTTLSGLMARSSSSRTSPTRSASSSSS